MSTFRQDLAFAALLSVFAAGCGGAAGGGTTMGGYSGMNAENSGRGASGVGSGSPSGGGLASLPADRILYSVTVPESSSVEIRQTEAKPVKEGTVPPTYVTLLHPEKGTNFEAFSPHPTVGNSFLFASRSAPDAQVGIYRNSHVKSEGATPIVPPTYDSVTHLQLTPDGSTIVYIATTKEGRRALYRAAYSGTSSPIVLDDAEQAYVSPTGDTVVYSKGGDLYQRPVVGEGEARRLTETPERIESYPSLSRDGKSLVFSAAAKDEPEDLFIAQVEDLKTEKQLTQTADIRETGASFNEDAAKIAYVGRGLSDGKLTGVYVVPASGGQPVRVVTETNLGEDVAWTGQEGRGIGGFRSGFRLHLQRIVAPKAK